jgi:hypothetical protein
VAKELIVYWEWEDANWLLNRHIAAFEDLLILWRLLQTSSARGTLLWRVAQLSH